MCRPPTIAGSVCSAVRNQPVMICTEDPVMLSSAGENRNGNRKLLTRMRKLVLNCHVG